jgi:hypothetical protein
MRLLLVELFPVSFVQLLNHVKPTNFIIAVEQDQSSGDESPSDSEED